MSYKHRGRETVELGPLGEVREPRTPRRIPVLRQAGAAAVQPEVSAALPAGDSETTNTSSTGEQPADPARDEEQASGQPIDVDGGLPDELGQ